MTFEQSIKKLPIQRIGRKLYIYDWEYYPRTVTAKNRKTGEVFMGTLHELVIEKGIWCPEMMT